MAISNSIDFTLTRDDIITEALELLGVLGEGETPTTDQLNSSSRSLNMIIKAWQADGLNLFAVTTEYLFTQKDQLEYALVDSTPDHFTRSFVETTFLTDVDSGTSIFDVTSTADLNVDDNIGLASGGDVQWTTIFSINSATSITTNDVLENDHSAGETVYAYTTTSQRPMKIMEAYIHIQSSGTDIPIGHISRRRYDRLSVKDTEGVVNQFYYDPQIGTGNFFVWPTSDDEKNYVIMKTQRTLSDLDTDSDNPEVPQEWYLALCYALAVAVAPKYGTPDQLYYKIERQFNTYYQAAFEFDEELYTSVYFTVDYRGEEL